MTPETRPSVPEAEVASQHPEALIATESIDSERLAAAFNDGYVQISQNGDLIDVVAGITAEKPKNAYSYGIESIPNIMGHCSLILLSNSILPSVALTSYRTFRGMRRKQTFKSDWHEKSRPTMRASLDLSEALGGVDCQIWHDTISDQLLIGVSKGKTIEDNQEIVKRLAFLQYSIKGTPLDKKFGGFILPAQTATDVGIETAAEPLTKILQKKLRNGYQFDSAVTAVHVTGLPHTETGVAPSMRDIVRGIFETHEPNHPLVAAIKADKPNAVLRNIAQTSLSERLREVNRPSHMKGERKKFDSVTVMPRTILRHRTSQRVEVIPIRDLQLDLTRPAPTDTILSAAEYSLYMDSLGSERTKQKKLDITACLEQDIKVFTALRRDLMTSLTAVHHTKNIINKHSSQRVWIKNDSYNVINPLRGQKIKRQFITNMALGSLAFGYMVGATYGSAPGTSTLPTPAGARAQAIIKGTMNTIEQGTPPLRYMGGEFQDLKRVLTAVKPNQILQAVPEAIDQNDQNIPQWYITAPNGVNISGYWDKQRKPILTPITLSNGVQTFQWIDVPHDSPTADVINTLPELNTLDPFLKPYVIDVNANVVPTSNIVEKDGSHWVEVNVPVLHDHWVIAGAVQFVIGKDNTAKKYTSDTLRRLATTDGTRLYAKLPTSALPKDGTFGFDYLSVSFQLSEDVLPQYTAGGVTGLADESDKIHEADPSSYGAKMLLGSDISREQNLNYSLKAPTGIDETGDGIFSVLDLDMEVTAADETYCIPANTIYAEVSDESLTPVVGSLLKQEAIEQDTKNFHSTTEQKTFLAGHDSHFYLVDMKGKIVDATPLLANFATEQYFEHPDISKDATIHFASSAIGAVSIWTKPTKKAGGTNLPAEFYGLAGIPLLYISGRKSRKRLSKRTERRLFDPEHKPNVWAGALAVAAGYKPTGITDEDIDNVKTLPSVHQLALLDPKQVKKTLKSSQNDVAIWPADRRRAVRMGKASRKAILTAQAKSIVRPPVTDPAMTPETVWSARDTSLRPGKAKYKVLEKQVIKPIKGILPIASLSIATDVSEADPAWAL